jgi:nucleotide-binding universal stress UspA family protein
MALETAMSLLRRILVATDFSSSGHSAVARAGQLADQFQCQLMVCHATPDWSLFSERATANQQHYAEITRNAEELMRREIAWLAQEYRLTTARGEVNRDRATLAVSRAIESFQPDLLVIGAGGEHILLNGETVLGGTALKLISRVTIPLLLVRNASPVAYTSTLAAVGGDLSAARRLTRWASALAGSGTCHVVRAYDAPYAKRMRLCNVDDTEIAHSADEQRRLAQQDCEVLERTTEPGTHLAFHILRGAPVSTVLSQVQQWAPQLVVIGQHQPHADEHPGAWAAGLGIRIAYHCPTDVLMIP